MMEGSELQAVIEAILFVASEPVPRAKLLETFGEDEKEAAAAALQAVIDRYSASAEDSASGIVMDEVAGGLRLVTRPELHGHLRRFFEITGSNRLTMASLETLAIIAYRQPITGPEIAELRGVSAAGVLKKLLEKRLVRIAGRKEVVGKPFLYATTREFLMHFGLRSLKELPPLEQFEEMFGSGGDAEGLPEPAAPDLSEQAARESATLEQEDDDAFAKAERDQIDDERAEAEAEAAVAEAPPPEAAPKTKKDPSAAAEPASEDPAAGPEEPSGDGEDEDHGK